ncbi:hypothetical protein BpHYR1_047843, partial [Brachionus plicatilis]
RFIHDTEGQTYEVTNLAVIGSDHLHFLRIFFLFFPNFDTIDIIETDSRVAIEIFLLQMIGLAKKKLKFKIGLKKRQIEVSDLDKEKLLEMLCQYLFDMMFLKFENLLKKGFKFVKDGLKFNFFDNEPLLDKFIKILNDRFGLKFLSETLICHQKTFIRRRKLKFEKSDFSIAFLNAETFGSLYLSYRIKK